MFRSKKFQNYKPYLSESNLPRCSMMIWIKIVKTMFLTAGKGQAGKGLRQQ